MIYVLFGPPGVGKSYIGKLISDHLKLEFFDADSLITGDELRMIQNGTYTQNERDKFVLKLEKKTEIMLSQLTTDGIITEAFTKQKNRNDFIQKFNGNIKFIMISAPKELANRRVFSINQRVDHAINEKAFEIFWNEFDLPMVPHDVLNNIDSTDAEIIKRFVDIRNLNL